MLSLRIALLAPASLVATAASPAVQHDDPLRFFEGKTEAQDTVKVKVIMHKPYAMKRNIMARAHKQQNQAGPALNAFSLSSDGKIAMSASETSSKNDFDYLVGKWNIRNRTLKEPLAGSDEWEEFDATQEFRLILLGLGNVDIFHTELDGKPFEGLTVRLFDPETRLWTIYWADSKAVKLDDGKVGSFDGDEGDFFGREVVAGKDVIVKFHWDKRNPKAPIYSRAFSADAGRTWEWNWHSKFSRR